MAATISTAVVASTAITLVPYHSINVGASGLTDIYSDAYYYDAVIHLVGKGVIKGFDDGTFRPGKDVTRGDAAAMIARALHLDKKTSADPGFRDVSKNASYYSSIAALVEADIVDGVTKDSFQPKRTVTRAEMAKMVAKAFKLQSNSSSHNVFTDVPNGKWYSEFIKALYDSGVTQGKTVTTFAPSENVLRGQLATFIYRAQQSASPIAVIDQVSNLSVTINGQSYKVADPLKPLFSSSNAEVLENAKIKFEQENGTIISVEALEITNSGKQSGDLVLDGKGSVIDGKVTINGDYVTVKNLKVKGNFTVGKAVQNRFLSEKLVVEGQTIVSDESSAMTTASTNSSKAKIVLSNSTFKIVEISKKDTVLEVNGTTSLQEINASANVNIVAASTVMIPKIQLYSGANEVEINGNVKNLTVNSKSPIEITGNTNIESMKITQNGKLHLKIAGEIKQMETTNKDAAIIIDKGIKIGNLVIPAGANVKQIIENFDEFTDQIENINGQENTGTTPSPGGGGGGSLPTPDNTAPQLESATLIFGSKQKAAIKQGDSWVISLSGLASSDKLTSINIDSNEAGTASIAVEGLSSVERPLELDSNGKGSFTVKDVLGLDLNLTVDTLKLLLVSQGTEFTGTIADKSNNSTTIKIKVDD